MIANDFKIDFEKKKIYHVGKNKKIYSAIEFYSFLQDTFDEPENMMYEIPIKALSSTQYKLINGWTIDEQARKYLKEGILVAPLPST